jgi:phosphatidylglycerol:prolipoprotein diacylglycerol transferase
MIHGDGRRPPIDPMSRRGGFRPGQRRGQAPRTSARSAAPTPQRTATQAEQLQSEGLAVTVSLDPGADGAPYPAIVRFVGRRTDVRGKPTPADSFTRDERIDTVVPGSGPISVTTWAYHLNPGDWEVTAELIRQPAGPGAPARAKGQGHTLPRATWSWSRWRLVDAPYGAVRTRSGIAARLSSVPAVIHGSWSALVGLGIIIGTLVQILLLAPHGIEAWEVILVTAVAVAAGLLGAKLWYVVLRPRQWRRSLGEGWSVDGSIVAAPLVGLLVILALGLPPLVFLDASTPAFFFGVAIGRLGCFFTGCCSGRCTASRFAVWSSDRRIGARRIPTQLLESAIGLGLGVLLTVLFVNDIPPVDGVIFVGGVGTYLVARQFLLRLRSDPRQSSLSMERSPTAAA